MNDRLRPEPPERTGYGFTWGPMEITRLVETPTGSGRGVGRVIRIATDHHKVEVYVSPQGRSVRVYIDGAEVTP